MLTTPRLFLRSFRQSRPLFTTKSAPTFVKAFATMATDPTKYKLNHSMIRVKDPKRSVQFYEFLGMKLINKLENPDAKFDLYFLAYDSPKAASHGNHWTDREGIVELTHNYGTENDPDYNITNGNTEPHKGFGHLCISVDNIQAACQRLEEAGYKFQKKLTDGRMRHIAFALDPDGYWVEVIGQQPLEATENVKETDVQTYRMNHTMIRVKDHKKSLAFYEDVMGMKLKRVSENKEAKFNLYFLGYGSPAPEQTANGVNPIADQEGLLELTWNYGTEDDAEFKYHNGNDQPQGFGHICVSVDDLDAACSRWEEKGVNWKKRLTDGRMKNIAFILDPDNYWIEVVQNEKLKQRSNW
ncbi:lactoylglutathione lyase [Diplodia corticola]|uniref:Lactoylglutathione lyase n=1 Tax=Diplodia corticola TaxID=236234 RepID=A0A1J9S7Y2_9PEZI|nr:lactoylglutathione lyase [Diplodia corticola]OJD36599.1 lactoylglutathione lyase [Diplodia corticola]